MLLLVNCFNKIQISSSISNSGKSPHSILLGLTNNPKLFGQSKYLNPYYLYLRTYNYVPSHFPNGSSRCTPTYHPKPNSGIFPTYLTCPL